MKMRINNFLIIIFLLTITYGNAQAETFIREYTYQASELDSKVTSKENAIKQLKRELIEYIGVHIRSNVTIQRNSNGHEIMNHDIQALSEGFTKNLHIIDEKWNGKEFYIKASINVYPSNIFNKFKLIQEDVNKHISNINENPDKALCEKTFSSVNAKSIYSKALKEGDKQKINNARLEDKAKKTLKHSGYTEAQKIHDENRRLNRQFDEKIIGLKRCAAYFGRPDAQIDMYFSSVNRFDEINKDKWLASAAKKGNEVAMYWFAGTIYGGFTVRKNDTNSSNRYFWWYKSALKGYPPAMFEIGRAYYEGVYYDKDLEQAEHWLNKSIAYSGSLMEDAAVLILQQIQQEKLKQ